MCITISIIRFYSDLINSVAKIFSPPAEARARRKEGVGGGNFLPVSRPKPCRLPNVLGRDPQKNVLILLEKNRAGANQKSEEHFSAGHASPEAKPSLLRGKLRERRRG
ncbi:MAG: hypothetical protein A3G57_00290 [Candidatus Andersenbacteria bacterium RIFCSPLOWO2_12_FULL_45_8]|nr:MAG: hypothetical protein A3B76_05065 [Candidatus Andersenbacteria bacterium RIFCSPHIGHO2_02_FULL_46_16]OGY41167.1 MAG: hypothetical protein A3G57_00290 [Candidatus Andersenbacteria bacterium RIFCSPLOWO2_12_FULL_45_8]OGY82011.1 MAG: hypothetical protein A3E60_04800 [Candidatus Kerfeldbacteria bacterium RIFCSPHIGHO2_12_FULL_42_13]OGY84267.1 MAG: hypothetical protein A3I91_01120 [Candidatus Kerfeldbacteria bacterium RIFCSPLOWO2_02_FULL_42_19]